MDTSKLHQKNIRIKKALLIKLDPPVYKNSKHPIGFRPPYTLKYIEALLSQGQTCSVRCIDQRVADISLKNTRNLIYEWQPDVVIFDISTLVLSVSVELCKQLKRDEKHKNIITVGIGQEISANPMRFNKEHSEFDITIAGEAEFQVASIIEKLNKGMTLQDIKNFYETKALESTIFTVENLNDLPFPDYDISSLKTYSHVYPIRAKKRLIWGHMLTSRGCPHGCIFCSQIMRESYGEKVRLRTAQNVVDEMEHLVKIGANIIVFDDDNFTSSAAHIASICDEIKSRKLKVDWVIHARVDEVSLTILKMLKNAGCKLIRFGIESGSKDILNILKKSRDPNSWIKNSKKAVEEAMSLGISVACLFIVGSPTETTKDLQKSIDFAKKLSPDIVQVAYFTPFPGSTAYSIFKDRIAKYDLSDIYHYEYPAVNLSHLSNAELKKAQTVFYKKFLMRPTFILKHFCRYLPFYVNNINVLLKLLHITPRIISR